MYLTGEFQRNLDSKMRLTLPAELRDEFANEYVAEHGLEATQEVKDSLKVKVCLVPMKDAVYGFSPSAHREWLESLFEGGYNAHNKKHVVLRRMITAKTVTLDIDKAGRVSLGKMPEGDLAKYPLEREVSVVGNVDHFEIWNADKYAETMAEFDDDMLEDLIFGM